MNKKFIQVGCGKMSKYTMQYAIDKGYELVGAYDISENIIGKKISSVFSEVKSNIVIEHIDELKKVENKFADIAIVTTMSLLNDIADVSRIILSKQINSEKLK